MVFTADVLDYHSTTVSLKGCCAFLCCLYDSDGFGYDDVSWTLMIDTNNLLSIY